MSLFLHQNRFGEVLYYISCSAVDPLQSLGAVRMRVQTAEKKHHKNPQVVHMTPVQKSCVFVINKKSIIKTFLTSMLAKIMLSPRKVVTSESVEKYAQIKHRLQEKTVLNCSEQIFQYILM